MVASDDGAADSTTGVLADAPAAPSTPPPTADRMEPEHEITSPTLSAADHAVPTGADILHASESMVGVAQRALTDIFSGLWAMVQAVPTSILAFISMWIFVFFPWLRPWEPPVERQITINDLALAERDKDLGDGRLVNSMYFVVEASGYDADLVAVDWLEYDVQTRQRLSEMPLPKRWGVIDFNTRSDRVIGEIEVPPPENHPGCVFVRVFLRLVGSGGEAAAILAAADSAAFDPLDGANPECADATPAVPPLR